MEKQLKEIIRSVLREEFISELSKNDVHVKEIMKFYDKGTYSTKKAVSIFVSGKTNATRNQILDDLADMGYNDAWEVMDHFKLTLESINEAPQKVGNVNAFGASKVLGKGKKVLGFVPDTPNAVATLIQDFPQAVEIEFKQGFVYKGDNHKSIKKGSTIWKELEKRYLDKQTKDAMKAGFSIKESVNESTLNEGFGDSIKKIRNLAIRMASTKFDRAKSHMNLDKIASSDEFDGKDAMNKATSALLQQTEMNEDLKSTINKIAVKLGTGSTMLGIITALVSMSGWIQYLDSSFTKWYYTEIQKLAEPEVMKVMQDLGRAGQAEGSIYGKLGMYAFFIFFTIAVISLVAARMTKGSKNEYVDKKGVEHVAAALPQTEEEPIKECKTC